MGVHPPWQALRLPLAPPLLREDAGELPQERLQRRELLLLSGAVAIFCALAGLRAKGHPFPFYDDVAYLDAANRIREGGGLLALLRDLFTGAWAEDNRNPLYLALLSLLSSRSPGFHPRAQLLGVAIGALALLCGWLCARRLYGPPAALWLALLLAVSETLIAWSAREACEPLLLLCCALAFAQLLRPSTTLRSLFWGGLFTGLGQLCKSTGILVPLCAALALAWEHRASLRTALARIAALASGFLLGALPLLWRNQLRFGAPLHNFNNRLLWIDPLDDFSEIFAPGALERLDRGPLAYLRALTPAKALERLGRGLGETLVHLGDSLSLVSPRPFGPVHLLWIAVGLGLAALSLRALVRSPRGFARTLLLLHAAATFAFFVFYNAVSGSSRYLLPLAFTLLLPLAQQLAWAQERIASFANDPGPGAGRARPDAALCAPARRARRAVLGAYGGIGAAVLLALLLDPRDHAPPPGFAAAVDALRARVKPGEVFAIDARTRLQPAWAMDPSIQMETISTAWQGRTLPSGELLAALRARSVRWLLLDGTSRKGDAPRWFFADELPLLPDGSLPMRELPGVRWSWTDEGNGLPRHFALLELLPQE